MKKLALILLGTAALSAPSYASIVLSVSGADFKTSDGTLLPGGTLFQLINLGPDGIFGSVGATRINVDDGTTTGLERWVSGDDSVLSVAVIGGDFATTAAFDLFNGPDATPGYLDRVFEIPDNAIPLNAKIGIRWFPGLLASNFASITLAGGQKYGEFTRQSNPGSGEIWVASSVSNGAVLTFDPMLTSSFGGTDGDGPNQVARAYLDVVPEPGSMALALVGAAGLAVLRRRRA